MATYKSLQRILDDFEGISDEQQRIQMLISYSKRFEEVASRPFDQAQCVPECESDVYIRVDVDNDNNIDFYAAVENPQGLSAKALGAVLQKALKDTKVEDIEKPGNALVYKVFGKQLSIDKNMGLMGMVK